MKLNRTGSRWDRNQRININDNWDEIERKYFPLLNLGKEAESTLKKALEINAEAQKTNDMNKAVDDRLDNIIADSGTSSTEVVDARGSHTVLSGRLENQEEEIIRSRNGISQYGFNRKGLNVRNRSKGSLVIIDDDIRSQLYTELYPFAVENDIVINAAVISSRIDTTNYTVTSEQIKEMQDSGHVEFLNHTHTHKPLADLTPEEIEEEILLCEQYLESIGVFTKHLVYPFGSVDDRVKEIAAKHVFSATKTNELRVDTRSTFDSFEINRLAFEQSIASIETQIRLAAETGGAAIINTHVNYTTFNTAKLKEIVDLARSYGLEIRTYSDAFRDFGNIAEIRHEGKLLGGISSNGRPEGFFHHSLRHYDEDINISSTPESYQNSIISTTNITNNKATELGFAHGAGVLFTDRRGNDDYTYQIYFPIRTNVIYKRYWDSTSGSWSDFEKVGGLKDVYSTKRGPYNIAPGELQNINLIGVNVSRNDAITATVDEYLPSGIIMGQPAIYEDGKINLRLINYSDTAYEVPEANYTIAIL